MTKTNLEGIRLTHCLQPGNEQDAVKALQRYYAPLSGTNTGFTGGLWDTFDPSGTRTASANTFTADDLVACALLSTPIPGRAAVELLSTQRRRFEMLLEDVGPDREFTSLTTTDDPPFTAARRLYLALMELSGVGGTRATKLLARKRPRMVPIIDSVIAKHVFSWKGRRWARLLDAMKTDDLQKHLTAVRKEASLTTVPLVRIFDVLAWMDSSKNTQNALKKKAAVESAAREDDALGGDDTALYEHQSRADGHRFEA